MTRDSVNQYVEIAREYGKKHRIEELVEEWIQEGRTIDSPESAREWANSLP
jgi:hypothetical protein